MEYKKIGTNWKIDMQGRNPKDVLIEIGKLAYENGIPEFSRNDNPQKPNIEDFIGYSLDSKTTPTGLFMNVVNGVNCSIVITKDQTNDFWIVLKSDYEKKYDYLSTKIPHTKITKVSGLLSKLQEKFPNQNQ